jgi:CoA:oxalate CoA-transferase
MAFPLEGIKVLDLTRALSGPFATRILADLGADVVKVEPPDGDLTRIYGSKIGNLSSHFTQHNVGKRNVCVDLGVEGASELVLELADKADIVVENFRPGVMDRNGLGWDVLHERNPRLIMLSISGFGQVGPERDRAAYAPVLHAETGLVDRFSAVHDNRAVDFPLSLADTTASVHGTIGILAALVMAQQTGLGQHIDLAMINAQFYNDDYLSMVINDDKMLPGSGDVWVIEGGRIMIAAPLKFLWRKLQDDHGQTDDPGTDELRRETIRVYLASLPSWEAVTDILDNGNLAWGRVRPYAEAIHTSPSVGPRRILTEVDDRVGGKRLTTEAPYHFSDAESGVRRPAAYRGEHNAEVLAEWLGRSSSETDALAETGVLAKQDPIADRR